MRRFAQTMALVLVAGVAAQAWAVDFAKEIEPILAENCFKCHGADKDKGDLRLHTKEDFTKSEFVVVAGKPQESELFLRISLPADDADIMPPKGDPLPAEQQQLIKQWIEEGAEFGDWTEAAPLAGDQGEGHAPVKATSDKLPEVPAASEEALARLREAGALAMPLANNTNLLNIDFRAEAANVGDSHLALLKPVAEQVAWLGLAGTQVTDTGLAQLKDLKNLRRLHLEKTSITDEGIQHLSGLSNLRYLNLYGTKITDRGLNHLTSLVNLEKLYLWQTDVSDYAVRQYLQARAGLWINRGWESPPAPAEAEEPKKAEEAPAAAAATEDPELTKFKALAANFTGDSCCDKALKGGTVCAHPCCKEALAKNEVCKKCNPS